MTITAVDIPGLRLRNQHVAGPQMEAVEAVEDVVHWMGAVQAQEYPQAAWGLGLRARNCTAEDVDRALEEGSILRTHVMRPTWHFVSSRDIRWLLELTGPRVRAGMARRYRELRLDDAACSTANDRLARALEGGIYMTRAELGSFLEEAGIDTGTPQRLPHILMRAELDGVICSGPKRGKQYTYALLDERTPSERAMDREAAVVALVRRYFFSHGPATLRDFAWWSGLTMSDARAGLEALKEEIASEQIDGQSYWLPRNASLVPRQSPSVHLLPAFDEYTVAYADRRAVLRPEHFPQTSEVMLGPVIVVDGLVAGSWKRTIKRDSVVIEVSLFSALGEKEARGVAAAADRYGEFLGLPARVIGNW